jgi:hypothetical protein
VLNVTSNRFTGLLRIDASLDCPTCMNETIHEVRYVAGLLNRIRCVRCGQHWQMARHAAEEAYLRQLVSRVATKPLRLGLEAGRHPIVFAFSLPRRVVTKPWRIASEVATVTGLAPSRQ